MGDSSNETPIDGTILYQEAQNASYRLGERLNQGAILALLLKKRILNWLVVSIVSGLIFYPTYKAIDPTLSLSYKNFNKDISQTLILVNIASAITLVFGTTQTISTAMNLHLLNRYLNDGQTNYSALRDTIEHAIRNGKSKV